MQGFQYAPGVKSWYGRTDVVGFDDKDGDTSWFEMRQIAIDNKCWQELLRACYEWLLVRTWRQELTMMHKTVTRPTVTWAESFCIRWSGLSTASARSHAVHSHLEKMRTIHSPRLKYDSPLESTKHTHHKKNHFYHDNSHDSHFKNMTIDPQIMVNHLLGPQRDQARTSHKSWEFEHLSSVHLIQVIAMMMPRCCSTMPRPANGNYLWVFQHQSSASHRGQSLAWSLQSVHFAHCVCFLQCTDWDMQ